MRFASGYLNNFENQPSTIAAVSFFRGFRVSEESSLLVEELATMQLSRSNFASKLIPKAPFACKYLSECTSCIFLSK